MLLFIGKATGESVRKELFQYISCYSLSASTFKNRSEYWRFNTSHVTLYPAHPSTFTVIFAFQYISCYSLSESCCRCFCSYHVSIHLMLLFIESPPCNNIWFYRVSIHLMLLFIRSWKIMIRGRNGVSIHLMLLFISYDCNSRCGWIRFNTSHVTLYPRTWLYTTAILCFNTSHVTLYPVDRWCLCNAAVFQYISCYSLSRAECPGMMRLQVSIHLMLLFIGNSTFNGCGKLPFQYISCYSLSLQPHLQAVGMHVSIHLMLLFIPCWLLAVIP